MSAAVPGAGVSFGAWRPCAHRGAPAGHADTIRLGQREPQPSPSPPTGLRSQGPLDNEPTKSRSSPKRSCGAAVFLAVPSIHVSTRAMARIVLSHHDTASVTASASAASGPLCASLVAPLVAHVVHAGAKLAPGSQTRVCHTAGGPTVPTPWSCPGPALVLPWACPGPALGMASGA